MILRTLHLSPSLPQFALVSQQSPYMNCSNIPVGLDRISYINLFQNYCLFGKLCFKKPIVFQITIIALNPWRCYGSDNELYASLFIIFIG